MTIVQAYKSCRLFSKLVFSASIAFLLLLNSCYYDNEEALYPVRPGTSNCDTVSPTYILTIQPIISNNCLGCHSGGFPSADLDLSTIDYVKTAVTTKNLMDHVLDNGFSLMPPSEALSDCNKKELDVWIAKGMPAK